MAPPARKRDDGRGRGHAPRITAVEVFLYRFREDGVPEYLLLKRESGLWQPPCGKIEPRETPLQAARREAFEETGFKPELVRPAHWADPFVDPERGRLYFLPVFFAEVPLDHEVKIGSEHTEYVWMTPTDALERLPYHGYREALKAVEAARLEAPMRTTPPGVEGPRKPRRRRGGRRRSRKKAEDGASDGKAGDAAAGGKSGAAAGAAPPKESTRPAKNPEPAKGAATRRDDDATASE